MDYHADPVEHAARYYDRLAREAEIVPGAESKLTAEFKRAFLRDVSAVVETPGWGRPQREAPITEVVMDTLAGPKCEHIWADILGVVAATARGELKQDAARVIVDALARDYGAFHAADYVHQRLSEDDSDERCTDAYDCGGAR